MTDRIDKGVGVLKQDVDQPGGLLTVTDLLENLIGMGGGRFKCKISATFDDGEPTPLRMGTALIVQGVGLLMNERVTPEVLVDLIAVVLDLHQAGKINSRPK